MTLHPVADGNEPQRGETVSFMGRDFRMADRIGLMPLLRFAKAAKTGMDSADIEGLAAMYDLLGQCIAEDEWQAFNDHADKTRADDADLMAVIQDVTTVLASRPTSRPTGSSGGSQSGKPTSGAVSSSLAVVRRLKYTGRPDLALAVVRSQHG